METACALPDAVAPAGALDLHEGIDDPLADGCRRWPETLRLLNHETGELVTGRCKATNLCRYCQALYVVETVEMLTLDATEYAPALWAVLTAREHLTRAECRRHLRQVLLAARKVWPACEWFVQVEFQRRGALHLNLLVKGVPAAKCDEFLALISKRWCARVDALPVGQWAEPVNDGVGVTRYISKMLAHGLKREQAPPIGWRGHRTSQTKGYLVRPASVMRQEAKRALRLKRLIWKGLDADAAELELAARERESWELRAVRPETFLTSPATTRRLAAGGIQSGSSAGGSLEHVRTQRAGARPVAAQVDRAPAPPPPCGATRGAEGWPAEAVPPSASRAFTRTTIGGP